LNAQNIQEVFNIIPEEELRKSIRQKELIKRKVHEKINQVPLTFLRIIKNNAAIRNEFSVFKMLQEARPRIEKQKHEIRRALSNILYRFTQEFEDIGVGVQLSESNIKLYFDYSVFEVVIQHLMDNASKYVLPHNSELIINFRDSDGSFVISFDMMSMEILPEEVEKIHQEGFSGYFPKKSGKNGKGIGLGVIHRLLPLIGAELVVIPNANPTRETFLNDITYKNNIFEIHFQRKMIVQE
jgi:K+-sensing histidine kinase KdpD